MFLVNINAEFRYKQNNMESVELGMREGIQSKLEEGESGKY